MAPRVTARPGVLIWTKPQPSAVLSITPVSAQAIFPWGGDVWVDSDRSLVVIVVRYEGVVLLLTINYFNFHPFGLGPEDGIYYTYSARMLSGTESKVLEQERHGATGSTRVFRDRHGIKIVVLQAGSLRSLSGPALIVTLTSSVFLIALSTAFVDCKLTSHLPVLVE